jgi:hypothetical protein
MTTMDLDPIAELVEALAEDGRPSLAWLVRWSADGREPVAAAWGASVQPFALLTVLERGGVDVLRFFDPERWGACRVCWTQVAPVDDPRGYLSATDDDCPACAAAIRRAVPVPPTLPELLAARAAGGAW